jgi:single-stranded-DNA-specific exonuclease
MAAGLAIKAEHISSFARGLSQAVGAQLAEAEIEAAVEIEGEIPLNALSLGLVSDFERLAPFGPGNPQPILMAKDVKVTSTRKLGRNGAHLRLQIEDPDGGTVPVFWWSWRGAKVPDGVFDLAYRIRRNVFNGKVELQVEWVDGRIPVKAKPVAAPRAIDVEIVEGTWVAGRIEPGDEVEVWREGPRRDGPAGCDRYSLAPAETLVIWTLPSSVDELTRVLQRVQPTSVWIVGEDPGTDAPQQFVQRLGGLVKYALSKREGEVQIATLASAMAHREVTIRLALNWLEAKGDVKWEEVWDGIRLSAASRPDPERQREYLTQLKTSIEETRRYRTYLGEDRTRLKRQVEQIVETVRNSP